MIDSKTVLNLHHLHVHVGVELLDVHIRLFGGTDCCFANDLKCSMRL